MAPAPVFLLGKSHGQQSWGGCSPQGRRVRYDWAHVPFSCIIQQKFPAFNSHVHASAHGITVLPVMLLSLSPFFFFFAFSKPLFEFLFFYILDKISLSLWSLPYFFWGEGERERERERERESYLFIYFWWFHFTLSLPLLRLVLSCCVGISHLCIPRV